MTGLLNSDSGHTELRNGDLGSLKKKKRPIVSSKDPQREREREESDQMAWYTVCKPLIYS